MQPFAGVSTVQVEQTTYRNWNAVRISNHTVQLIVLTGVGPRVLWFGFRGEENEWFLCKDIPADEDEGWIDTVVLPVVQSAK